MIKYRYARGSDDSIVDVRELARNERYKLAPYTCFGCNGELIPNLGKIKVKYFSHKSAGMCSRETYLHGLAKVSFLSTYTKCLSENKSFIFKSDFPTICNHYHEDIGELCNGCKVIDVDLTKHFKKVELEKGCSGFVPDILLSTEDGSEVIFIEIAVTHKCDKNKIESGKRIIEFEIYDEDDVLQILNAEVIESSYIVNTYNFNKKTIEGDLCSGACSRKVVFFVIYESGKSILLEVSPLDAINKKIRGNVRYSEIIGFSSEDYEAQREIYKYKVRQAHFNGNHVSNCFLCRYHGLDGIENSIFCKFMKKSLNSNDAVDCGYYKVFRNMDECVKADKENEEYLVKNKSRLFVNAFMRIVDRNIY